MGRYAFLAIDFHLLLSAGLPGASDTLLNPYLAFLSKPAVGTNPSAERRSKTEPCANRRGRAPHENANFLAKILNMFYLCSHDAMKEKVEGWIPLKPLRSPCPGAPGQGPIFGGRSRRRDHARVRSLSRFRRSRTVAPSRCLPPTGIRPQMTPQRLEKIESAPGNGMVPEAPDPQDMVTTARRRRVASRPRRPNSSRGQERRFQFWKAMQHIKITGNIQRIPSKTSKSL